MVEGKGRWGSIELIEIFWPCTHGKGVAPKIGEILGLKVRDPK